MKTLDEKIHKMRRKVETEGHIYEKKVVKDRGEYEDRKDLSE